jgi:hypothetical protein
VLTIDADGEGLHWTTPIAESVVPGGGGGGGGTLDAKLTGDYVHGGIQNPAAWFDGNPATFLDGDNGDTWGGYDFTTNPKKCSYAKITARPGLESRASGVMIQGGNNISGPWTTLATVPDDNTQGQITLIPADTSVSYRYLICRMEGGYGNLCEVEFWGHA